MTTRYDVVIRGGTVAENAVRMMTPRSAAIIGLQDRGVLAPGYKANVNAIDHANLTLDGVTIAHDLPAGGRRLD